MAPPGSGCQQKLNDTICRTLSTVAPAADSSHVTDRPLRRIARNTASILAGDAASQIFTAAAIAMAALNLGRAGFGKLSEAQAFVDPLNAIATFGLQQVAITVCAQRRGCDGVLRGTILGIQGMLAPIAVIVTLASALVTGRLDIFPLICVICTTVLVTGFSTVASLPFQFDQSMHRLLLFPSIASFVRFALTYAAARYLNVPIGYQFAISTGVLTGTAVGFLAMMYYYPARLSFDRALAARMVAIAWPMAAIEFIVIAYSRGSYFLLRASGAAAQGEYAAADMMIRPLFTIATAILASSLPTIAVLAAQRNFASLHRAYVRTLVRSTQFLTVLLVAAWFLAPWLLRTYAPEYRDATLPFRILSIGALFMFLNQMSTTFLVALGRFRIIMANTCVNFVVYLGIATQLVPRYGAPGAAAATSIMEAINTIIQIAIVHWLLRSEA